MNSVAEGPFISGENIDTSSDLMLAQMLQMEFDREYDAQLRREEKKFNGDSKGTRPHMAFPVGGRKCLCTLLNKPSTILPFKFPFRLKTIAKFILLKTVTALKTRLTGRTLETIPTDQVLLVSRAQLGRVEYGRVMSPVNLSRFMFIFGSHLIIHSIIFNVSPVFC